MFPDAQPLFVIQYGGELENASSTRPVPRSTIRCRIARWLASASQVHVPDDGSNPGIALY